MTHRYLLLMALALPVSTQATSPSDTHLDEWWAEHGSISVSNISSTIFQSYTSLPQNRTNLLNIPEFTIQNELRPDIGLLYERFYFSLSPRFLAKYENYETGRFRSNSQDETDFFLNGYKVEFFPTPELSIAYTREDLQWGPSFLLSPSNPFGARNGKQEPKTEVLAADYAKIVWAPDFTWTVSFYANIGEGRQTGEILPGLGPEFDPVYAVKVDYLFNRGSASVIASLKDQLETEDGRLGGYFSYNLNDAWIAYMEGSLSTEDVEALTGLSYTFRSGLTVALEYFHNSSGSTESPNDLVDLIQQAAEIDYRESFTRQNYLLLQAYQNDIYKSLDFILRHTQNLDDGSFSLLGHLEWDMDNNALGFISATFNSAGGGELDSLREFRVQAGIELIF